MLPASAFSSSDNTYLELVPISQKLYPIIVCNAAIFGIYIFLVYIRYDIYNVIACVVKYQRNSVML